MAGKQIITLITGANQGVGFEAAKNILLSSAAYHVLIGSRDPARGAKAGSDLQSLPDIKGTVATIQIDVTDDQSVDAAADHISSTYGRLNVLVNNAGIASASPKMRDRDSLREILAVNTVGALSVTEAFLPLLRASSSSDTPSRLLFVSSSMASITHAADPQSHYYRPEGTTYRASKAALNMIMVQYWNLLQRENRGFKVFGVDPGLNATNLMGDAQSLRNRGAPEPHVGGGVIAAVIKGERDADVGKVCSKNGVVPW